MKGADPNATNERGELPLFRAALGGEVGAVRALLEHGADANGAFDGETPLLLAATHGHDLAVRLLLSKGAMPNARCKGGETALCRAARQGHADVVTTLLAASGDPMIACDGGWAPLALASAEGHIDVVRVLCEWARAKYGHTTAATTTTTTAASCAEREKEDIKEGEEEVRRFIEVRTDGRRETPLFLAARAGYAGVVTYLLHEQGADPNVLNSCGDGPLHAAVDGQRTEAVRALLSSPRTDPNLKDSEGDTALYYAVAKRYIGLVRMLLKAGTAVMSVPHTRTACTCGSGQAQFASSASGGGGEGEEGQASLSVSCVAPAHLTCTCATNVATRTADLTHLHNAANGGSLPVIRALLAYGADVEAVHVFSNAANGVDAVLYRSLDIAVARGYSEVVSALADGGADMSISKRERGFTPALKKALLKERLTLDTL